MSARITKATYLIDTKNVIDQDTTEITPNTSLGVVGTLLCSMLNAVR